MLICTNKDAKLLTTGHDLDCANQQIYKPFSSQRALNEWKPQYSKKVLYKEAKQSLWIWNEIRSYQVIWKSNDKNRKQEESVHTATSSIRDNKGWRETASISKQNPMKLINSNATVFTRSTGLPWHPDAQEHESIPSRTIQMLLIKYVNFDLIMLRNPDKARIMQ